MALGWREQTVHWMYTGLSCRTKHIKNVVFCLFYDNLDSKAIVIAKHGKIRKKEQEFFFKNNLIILIYFTLHEVYTV